jgi:hypothetical protein
VRESSTFGINNSNDGTGVYIWSKQGVTQGDPLATFIYVMGMLPLTHQLKIEFPTVTQLCFADDAAAAGNFK